MGSIHAVRELSIEKAEPAVRTELKRRHVIEKMAFGVLWLSGGMVTFVLFFVILYLLIQGGAFFMGPESLAQNARVLDTPAKVREAVASDPYAIGYLPVSQLDGATKPIVLHNTMPSADSVLNGRYPLIQTLYLLSSGHAGSLEKAWLDFAISREGQDAIATRGFVPLEASSAYVPATSLSGELTIEGSTEMQPLAEALAAAFITIHPDVSVQIVPGNANGAVRAVGRAEVGIGMADRQIRDFEFVRYQGLEAYAVAHDGIALISHPTMSVGALTLNQAREIFSGNITNWQAVGGPDASITVVSSSTDSGAWEGFRTWVLSKRALLDRGMRTGDLRLVLQSAGASARSMVRFLVTRPLAGMGGHGGISSTIVTTVYMVLLTLAIATPVGVGAAIYLVEYAGEMGGQSVVMTNAVALIRFAVETLAGVPSIIYGLFGFALFVTVMRLGLSLLSGALAGACLIMPTIIRTTEEALLMVPRAYREGSLALGATKWQTNYQVVLPAALPGIVTGIILGVGRVVSETAIFYVTLGGSINLPRSVMDQGRTMVLHLYSLMMDANAPDPAMGTALVLIVVIVLINLSINYFSNRLSRSLRGTA